MKIILQWEEGRDKRSTEAILPNLPWGEAYIEHIRKALYFAFKYSTEKVPEGLLKEGEVV